MGVGWGELKRALVLKMTGSWGGWIVEGIVQKGEGEKRRVRRGLKEEECGKSVCVEGGGRESGEVCWRRRGKVEKVCVAGGGSGSGSGENVFMEANPRALHCHLMRLVRRDCIHSYLLLPHRASIA